MSGSVRELEEIVRQRLRHAYIYGALAMSLEGSVPLGYPDEDQDTAVILGIVKKHAARARERGQSR